MISSRKLFRALLARLNDGQSQMRGASVQAIWKPMIAKLLEAELDEALAANPMKLAS